MALVATKETCMTYPQRITHSLPLACSLLLPAVTATAAVAETSAPVRHFADDAPALTLTQGRD